MENYGTINSKTGFNTINALQNDFSCVRNMARTRLGLLIYIR